VRAIAFRIESRQDFLGGRDLQSATIGGVIVPFLLLRPESLRNLELEVGEEGDLRSPGLFRCNARRNVGSLITRHAAMAFYPGNARRPPLPSGFGDEVPDRLSQLLTGTGPGVTCAGNGARRVRVDYHVDKGRQSVATGGPSQ